MPVISNLSASKSTRIQGLDFLILPTHDLGRAEHVYRGILGLNVGERDMAVE